MHYSAVTGAKILWQYLWLDQSYAALLLSGEHIKGKGVGVSCLRDVEGDEARGETDANSGQDAAEDQRRQAVGCCGQQRACKERHRVQQQRCLAAQAISQAAAAQAPHCGTCQQAAHHLRTHARMLKKPAGS